MHEAQLQDIMRRLAKLEQTAVRYRGGEATDINPLDVALGGSDVSYTNVAAVGPIVTGDQVATLLFGNDMLALGAIGDGSNPHARMNWNGTAALTTNTHYGFSAAGGLSSLGITGTAQFDTTGATFAGDGDMLDLANGRIAAPIDGLYLTTLQATYAPSATAGPRSVNVRRGAGTVGGVAAAAAGSAGANSSVAVATGIWPVAAGSYLEATFYQNIGVNLNLTALIFAMAYLGPTPSGL